MKRKKGECTIGGNNERTELTPRCQPLRSVDRDGLGGDASGLEPVRWRLEASLCSLSGRLSHSLTATSLRFLFSESLAWPGCSFSVLPVPLSVVFQGHPQACLCGRVNLSLAGSGSMGWTFELGLIFESVGQIAGIALPILTPKKYFCTNGICNGLIS